MNVVTRATSLLVQPAAASTRSMFCSTARSCDSMSSPAMALVCGSTGIRPGMITRPPMRAPAGNELCSASRYSSWKTSPVLMTTLLKDRDHLGRHRHAGRNKVDRLVQLRTPGGIREELLED